MVRATEVWCTVQCPVTCCSHLKRTMSSRSAASSADRLERSVRTCVAPSCCDSPTKSGSKTPGITGHVFISSRTWRTRSYSRMREW